MRSFLGNHTGNIPIHFPKICITEHLTGGHSVLAITILQRSGVDLLAIDYLLPFGVHLLHDLVGHGGTTARNIGAAVLDRDKIAIGIRPPVPASTFLSSGMRYLSHTHTDEHSVALGANSRKSRWWPVP